MSDEHKPSIYLHQDGTLYKLGINDVEVVFASRDELASAATQIFYAVRDVLWTVDKGVG